MENNYTNFFRYSNGSKGTEATLRFPSQGVVIELVHGDMDKPHGTKNPIGTVKQERGLWAVYYDRNQSYSVHSEHVKKSTALAVLAKAANVHETDTVAKQINGHIKIPR